MIIIRKFIASHHKIASKLITLMQGDAVNLPEEENTPQKRVDKIFKHMDKVG